MNRPLYAALLLLASNCVIAQEIQKEKFLTLFEASSTGVICSDKSYLIRCYGFSPGDCFERTSIIAKACARENTALLPDTLDRVTAIELSNSIGACIEANVRREFKLPPNDQQCK
jgi:hypothetical protein